MRNRFMLRALPVAGVLASGLALAPGLASAATGTSVLSLALPGSLGGTQTCISGNCVTLNGVANLQISASAQVNALGIPLVTPAHAAGCSALVDVGATIHPGLTSGSVTVTLQYDRTNPNGHVIPGSHTSVTQTVALRVGGPPVTVTECASL
jgi:hypothetical protein